VIGDNKIAVEFLTNSIVTIDDNDTPCDTNDVIGARFILGAATRAFAGGPGTWGEETWGDGEIVYEFGMDPAPPVTVDAANPNGAGGCDYEIASAGFPPLLESNGGGTYIFDTNIVPEDPANNPDPATPDDDFWLAPSPVGVACVTEGNCGVSVDVTVGPGWSCLENAPGPCAEGPDGGSHFRGTRGTLENFLISVSTDSNGDIVAGTIFANNESLVFNVPPDPNSWDGPLLTFTGTCNNCGPSSLVRDDSFIYVDGSGTVELPIGANDSITGNTTVAITGMPDKGGTADPVNNNGGPVRAITVSYSTVAPVGEDETFVYTASNDSGDSGQATVTVTIVEDEKPAAGDFTRTLDTEGVDPSSLTDSFNALTEGGNSAGNGGTVTNTSAAGSGTSGTDGTNVTYSPGTTFFSGMDSFTYTITDENPTDAATGTVTIMIPDIDPIADDAAAETEADLAVDIPISFDLGNGSLAQHTVTAVAGSGTCTVDLGTAMATYTPDDGTAGEDTCTYTLADGDGSSDDGVIIITVEDTLTIKFPGGSALDPWSLALLLGLPLLRRRRAF
jgi:hypothetical protein